MAEDTNVPAAAPVAGPVIKSGDQTSEYALTQSSTGFARVLTFLGALTAGLPQILDLINMLPDSIKQNKFALIGTAVVGGLVALFGVVKETLVKIAYINGRSLVKAAAVRDAEKAPPVI